MEKSQELEADIALKLNIIGKKISEIRKNIEPNYKRFAANNKISHMTVWRIENGKDYKFSTLLELLKKLQVTPEDFFREISNR